MDTLFGVLMMEKLPNVEEFILYALQKRKRSSPGKKLLKLTKQWMKIDGIVQTRSLLHFINGILFPLLYEEVLSAACDFNDPEVLDTIMKVSTTSYNCSLLNWILSQDPKFVRCVLLGLPEIPKNKKIAWSTLKSNFIIALLCENPDYITTTLSEMEIRSAIHPTKDIVSIMALNCGELEKRKAAVSNFGHIRMMLNKEGAEASFKIRQIAWWYMEMGAGFCLMDDHPPIVLPYTQSFIKFLWTHAEDITAMWGFDIYLPLELKHMMGWKVSCKPWDQFLSWKGYFYFMLNWRKFQELRQISQRGRRWSFVLKEIKALTLLRMLDRQEDCSEILQDFRDLFIHKSEKYQNLDVRLLPFIIRYGGLEILKKSFRKFPKLTNTAWRFVYPQTLCDSLVLSVVDESQSEVYEYLMSLYSDAGTTGDNYYVPLLAPFFQMNPLELRRVANSICDTLEVEILNVFQVSWGEIFLRLLPNDITPVPNEYIIKHAVLDFIRKSVSLEVSALLNQVLQIMPSLRDFLLAEVAAEASIASNICHYYGTPMWDTSKRRFIHLIDFLVEVNLTQEELMTLLPKNRIEDFLLGAIVNIYQFYEKDGENSAKFGTILNTISDALLTTIDKTEKITLTSLLRLTEFWRECDWSIVLLTLGVYKTESPLAEHAYNTFSSRIYEDPVTPLLRVWLEYFGKEETRKVAEDEGVAIYKEYLDNKTDKYDDGPISGRDAAVFAVHLGSLKLLEAVAAPNIILWKQEPEYEKTLLDLSQDIWGTSHEITEFLLEKFNSACFIGSVSRALMELK